ncbi:MAG: hypothetical protein COA94_05610 [Rickettsiales bacterium]|nr:MAG: hypothetical protein COA94_05610 [Rickettsiales bacterium]
MARERRSSAEIVETWNGQEEGVAYYDLVQEMSELLKEALGEEDFERAKTIIVNAKKCNPAEVAWEGLGSLMLNMFDSISSQLPICEALQTFTPGIHTMTDIDFKAHPATPEQVRNFAALLPNEEKLKLVYVHSVPLGMQNAMAQIWDAVPQTTTVQVDYIGGYSERGLPGAMETQEPTEG